MKKTPSEPVQSVLSFQMCVHGRCVCWSRWWEKVPAQHVQVVNVLLYKNLPLSKTPSRWRLQLGVNTVLTWGGKKTTLYDSFSGLGTFHRFRHISCDTLTGGVCKKLLLPIIYQYRRMLLRRRRHNILRIRDRQPLSAYPRWCFFGFFKLMWTNRLWLT